MRKLFAATMMAVVLAGSTAFAFDSMQAVQGTVSNLDPNQKSVTLIGGETFTVAPNVSIEALRPGEIVTLMYRDGKDGQKELTAFWIDAGPGGDSRG